MFTSRECPDHLRRLLFSSRMDWYSRVPSPDAVGFDFFRWMRVLVAESISRVAE